jgi:hypothetical protein
MSITAELRLSVNPERSVRFPARLWEFHFGFSGHAPLAEGFGIAENGIRQPAREVQIGRGGMGWTVVPGNVNRLITVDVLAEASSDLDHARWRCAQAWNVLMDSRWRQLRCRDDSEHKLYDPDRVKSAPGQTEPLSVAS